MIGRPLSAIPDSVTSLPREVGLLHKQLPPEQEWRDLHGELRHHLAHHVVGASEDAEVRAVIKGRALEVHDDELAATTGCCAGDRPRE